MKHYIYKNIKTKIAKRTNIKNNITQLLYALVQAA